MRITTTCPLPECRETNVIEFENEIKPQEESSIPTPNRLNTVGIIQLSLTHDDHTLIIDVDHEGNIRKYSTVQKIETVTIHYIATVANRIKMMLDSKTKIIIVSRSALWKKFLLLLMNQIINDFNEEIAILKVTQKEIHITLNDLIITYNDFTEFTRGIEDNSILILDQNLFNNEDIVKLLKDNIEKITALGIALNHTLANFDPDSKMDKVDVIIKNQDLASVQYMIPDLESVVLFMLEILDKIFLV